MKYFMKNTMRRVSWMATASVVGFFGLLIIAMAGYAIFSKMLAPDSTMIADARCWLDIPAQSGGKCLKDRLADIKRKHDEESRKRLLEYAKVIAVKRRKSEAMTKVLKQTKAARDKLKKRFKELEGLENQFDNINLFANKTYKGSIVSTGVEYKKISTGQKWTKSWCYWQPAKKRDVNIHISLGKASPTGGVKWKTPTARAIKKAGVTKADIKAVKKLCVWPKGVS